MVRINVTVDGVRHQDDVEPRLLLVHYLRDRLGLVGQPATLFYDASGTLVSTWNGPLTPEALAKRLDRLVDAAE